MKKTSLTIILLVLISVFARAQSEKKFAVGLTGSFTLPGSDDYGYVDGFGISAKIEYAITAKLRLAFIPGYFTECPNYQTYKSYQDAAIGVVKSFQHHPVYKYIPLNMGLRYYYIKNVYVEGEAGEIFGANSIARNGFFSAIVLGGITTIDANNFFDFGAGVERGYRNNDYYTGAAAINHEGWFNTLFLNPGYFSH